MSDSEFVDSIINAHGGIERYNVLDLITIHFKLTGTALAFKRHINLLNVTAEISTREVKTVLRGLTSSSTDEEWVYTPKRVWKQSVAAKTVLEARDNPRDSFNGHERAAPWDDFQFAYFLGYAFWQYINFPWLLKRQDVSLVELDPHVESGEKWRVLEVEFPPQDVLGSHCTKQLYYFDESLSLRRHDYAPQAFGGSTAAHFTFDDIEVGGLKFPILRRVVRRAPMADGNPKPLFFGPTVFLVVFYSYLLSATGGEAVGSWALKTVPES